ncbi:type 1 glutamine amidotransferase [Pelagicoccus albus]|uniref:Type 1 glutamine amidotransferase n=1 Tax=Pelagicoccus albus TaxID=415222 RepID=A0A7X1E963_9BACT|nr:type 1 glutamine amidotransferase [Pelagicoccus albus]MBC2607026.1 type 1 glutamine amidotransferase [Pelagicoccus albus]
MPKLLIVDPLDLTLKSEDGDTLWSSKSCFEACLRETENLVCEYTTARDPELCRRASKANGVILGGSEASAWEDTVFNDQLLDLIAICKNNKIPFLGICYGAQLLGRALGARVGKHPSGIELGAPSIRLTKAGRSNPLLEGLGGDSFRSIETHSDAVFTVPPGSEILASTTHTPVQAFSYQGLLTGVQFHPEMNGGDLRFLWKAFQQKGLIDHVPEEYWTLIESCQCERKDSILRTFAERVRSSLSSRVVA